MQTNKFEAVINGIPVFLTTIALYKDCSLKMSRVIAGGATKGYMLTISVMQAQRWAVGRHTVAWMVSCVRVKMLVLEAILSLI